MARPIFEQVNSPCGEVLGLVECPGPPVCVVSIVRSGDILQVKSLMPTGGRVQYKQLRCHQTKPQLAITAIAIPQRIDEYAPKNDLYQEAVRCLQPGVSVGKILIQVNPTFYS